MSKANLYSEQSFFLLALLLQDELRQLIHRYTQNAADTQDLLHDTFLRLLICTPPASLDPASVRSFCRKTAKNIALNWLHRRDIAPITPIDDADLLELEDGSPQTEQVVNARQELAQAESAIEGLPARCKEIFRKSRIDGDPAKKIASDLNISTNTVNTHLQKGDRALHELAEKLTRSETSRLRTWRRRRKQP